MGITEEHSTWRTRRMFSRGMSATPPSRISLTSPSCPRSCRSRTLEDLEGRNTPTWLTRTQLNSMLHGLKTLPRLPNSTGERQEERRTFSKSQQERRTEMTENNLFVLILRCSVLYSL